jgi:quinohemoprotein ethanol dehydrogenase
VTAAAQGLDLYGRNCGVCHGFGGIGGDIVPDLRRSRALSDRTLWHAIVMDGVLQNAGMVGFKNYLSPDDAEAVRAYLNDRTRALVEQ